jgi:hypothetical protein
MANPGATKTTTAKDDANDTEGEYALEPSPTSTTPTPPARYAASKRADSQCPTPT